MWSLLEINQSGKCINEQLLLFKTEKDDPKIFQKENFLQRNRERQLFKKTLGTAGRHDLAVKLENYIVRGKS